ncbi:bleomycin resistance protein [Spirillospora sp. NPDC048911]|uniref:bleomycin resistance protein n=1 Tax=Spirillospora sp. NPDC048911 TaxID=3364527 RepID=UPI00371D4737
MGEKTTPIFPCRSIDDCWAFYEALGFELAFRQTRPNPFIAVQRGGIELQFFGLKGHDPTTGLFMCYVTTTGVDALYEAFRSGLKASLGRIPTRGLPRIGRLGEMSYGVRQFLVTDPDGNQLRIGQPTSEDFSHRPAPKDKVGKALHTARLFVNSKEDFGGAAKVLDHLLAADGADLTLTQRLEVLVLRADVALQLEDEPRAQELVAEAVRIELSDEERAAVSDELHRLNDLQGLTGSA